MAEADPNEKIKRMAQTCLSSVPRHGFTATRIVAIDQFRLPFVAIGQVSYANTFMEIICGIKIRRWIVCIEKSRVNIPESDPELSSFALGAFYEGDHFTFQMIPKAEVEKPDFSLQGYLSQWVFGCLMPVFYPNGVQIPERPSSVPEGSKGVALKIVSIPLIKPFSIPNASDVSEKFKKMTKNNVVISDEKPKEAQ